MQSWRLSRQHLSRNSISLQSNGLNYLPVICGVVYEVICWVIDNDKIITESGVFQEKIQNYPETAKKVRREIKFRGIILRQIKQIKKVKNSPQTVENRLSGENFFSAQQSDIKRKIKY